MGLKRHDELETQRPADFGRQVRYPTPNVFDLILVEDIPISPEKYRPLPYKTPHPDYDNNGLVLVWQGPVKAANNQVRVRRVYSAQSDSPESWYNAAIHYSGDAVDNPIYIRASIVLREDYVPLARGTTLTGLVSVKVTVGGTGNTAATTATITGGGGSGALVKPILAGGVIIGFQILAEGSGYTSDPSVVFGGPGSGRSATAKIQPAGAVLIKEETAKLDTEDPQLASLFIKVHRVYEVLPGPWIPFTRYDDDLGPVQGRRRAVLASGQIETLTATGKTSYEGRDGSTIVSMETEETWSDGTGSAGNPEYPIKIVDDYDKVRGPFQTTSQVIVATGTEEGFLVVLGGIANYTKYEPTNNPALIRMVQETWEVPTIELKTRSIGQDNLIPAKYRRLVKRTETNRQVESTYTFPTTLAGDQSFIELAEESAALARLKIIEEVIEIDADPLLGRETSESGKLAIAESIVNDGADCDEGFRVIKSTVTSLGNGKSIKITVSLVASAYPIIESQLYDEEQRVHYLETAQTVEAGTDAAAPSIAVVEEIKGIDAYRSKRIITTKNPTAVDYASAIVSEVRRPYKFPGRFDLYGYGLAGRYQTPKADLVKITLRTWWETGATKPNLDSIISDIIPTTLRIYESNLNDDGLHVETYESVLIDGGAYPGNGILSATIPSFEQYTGLGKGTLLTGTVAFTNNSAVVVGTGTLFTSEVPVGSYWSGSPNYTVASIADDTHLTLSQVVFIPAGSTVITNRAWIRPVSSTKWIGTSKIIGATIVPAREYRLWKIETQEVVMR